MEWKDVSLRQFNQIKGLDLTDLGDQITAAEILLGIKADDLTWKEYVLKLKELDFMDTEMPKVIIRKTYTLNGRKYRCNSRLDELNVARYMDFTNLAPTGELNKILAVVLIPEGKEYGEDIEQVYEDILDMSIVDVYAIFNFFKMQFIVCTKTMEDFSVRMLKGRKNRDIRRAISAVMDYCSMSDLL